jgi:hypothetical protein
VHQEECSATAPRSLSIALLVGTVLLGVGAAFHPILPHDPSAQLRMIAETWYFRPIHLAMLRGTALIILGIWTRRAALARPRRRCSARSRSWSLGHVLQRDRHRVHGERGESAGVAGEGGERTELGTLFDSLHRVGLMTARFGNFLIALGAIVLSWVERRENMRWPSRLAWIAGFVGLFCAICFQEASLLILAAVTLMPGWQVATALRGLGVAGGPGSGRPEAPQLPDASAHRGRSPCTAGISSSTGTQYWLLVPLYGMTGARFDVRESARMRRIERTSYSVPRTWYTCTASYPWVLALETRGPTHQVSLDFRTSGPPPLLVVRPSGRRSAARSGR